MGQWWNDIDRGKWGNGGMVLEGKMGKWWNDSDRAVWGSGGMIVTGENGEMVEWY